MSTELIPLRYVLAKMGKRNAGNSSINPLIMRYNIDIAGTIPGPRGPIRLITAETANRFIAAYRADQAAKDKPAPAAAPESPAELHLGALETKVDRLEAELRGVNQTLNELTKAFNLAALNLDKIMKDLTGTPASAA